MDLISIIVPVYNVEQYIFKCLNSCINQDVSPFDYEIIVVNDGTQDNSMSIVNEIASQHSNIYILNQQNQGLSMARNNGLAMAKGDYVWFVDSDDWIEPNCLKRIAGFLNNNLDLLQLQYRLTYDDSSLNQEIPYYTQEKNVLTGKEVVLSGGLPAPAQFTIYRRQYLLDNKLRFFPGIYHEDLEFKPRVTYYAKSIMATGFVCYNYYQRTSGSITSVFKWKNANDIITVMNNLHLFSRDFDLDEYRSFGNLIGLNMNTLLLGYRSLPSVDKKKIRVLLSRNKQLFWRMMRSMNLKYKLEGVVFIVNIRLGFLLHQLVR